MAGYNNPLDLILHLLLPLRQTSVTLALDGCLTKGQQMSDELLFVVKGSNKCKIRSNGLL